MRIVVFSDTHGSFAAANNIMKANPYSDHFLFLGDGLEEVESLREFFPDKKIVSVLGNCDHGDVPLTRTVEIFKTRIFMAHGHQHNVRESHELLIQRAKEEGAGIILYGHTHCRVFEYTRGMFILNPGSAAQPKDSKPPSYAVIDVTPCGINFIHFDV